MLDDRTYIAVNYVAQRCLLLLICIAVSSNAARAQHSIIVSQVAVCSGGPPCAQGCVVDKASKLCIPRTKVSGESGTRGIIPEESSLCDVAPPCPKDCKADATNRSCVEVKSR
jgi:hypothetical protein